MDESLVRVLPSSELEAQDDGGAHLRRVMVAGLELLLGRLPAGPVVAFSATCPHQGTDLHTATFVDGYVRCPLHGYLYDPGTGDNVVPTGEAQAGDLWRLKPGYLPVHPVEERDGWIWVSPSARLPPAGYDPALERPPDAGRPAADAAVDHERHAIRVDAGSTFELRLDTAFRPRFVWRTRTEGPLAVVGERLEPGPPPRWLVRVAAGDEGHATLRCSYARPWDREPAEVRTYVVRIGPA